MDSPMKGNVHHMSSSSSDSGDEAETNRFYRERIENLVKQLKYFQTNFQREKLRNESLQSLTSSMRDIRLSSGEQELALRRKNVIITTLQQRLADLGAETEVSLGEDEVFVLPSREKIDNLMDENRKLRESLRFTSFDPNAYEKALHRLRKTETDYLQLKKTFESLNNEYTYLKSTKTFQEDQKLREIVLLRDQLREAEQNTEVHSTLCQSLTDEKTSLKDNLQQTIEQMQMLKQKLCSQTDSDDARSMHPESLTSVQEENRKLKSAISLLKHDRNEVITTNQEWQSYDKERNSYVSTLEEKLRNSERSRAIGDTGITDEQREEVDRIVVQYKGKLETAEQARLEVLDENRQLRKTKAALEKSMSEQEKQLCDVQQNMQQCLDENERKEKLQEETISFLKAQLDTFKEDFESERRDRTNAMADLDRERRQVTYYKQLYDNLHEQIRQTAASNMAQIAQGRQEALNRYQQEYRLQQQRNMPQNYQPYVVPAGGRVVADGDDDVPATADQDVIDLPAMTQGAALNRSASHFESRAISERGYPNTDCRAEFLGGMSHARTEGSLLTARGVDSPSQAKRSLSMQNRSVSSDKTPSLRENRRNQGSLFDSEQSGTIFDNTQRREQFDASSSWEEDKRKIGSQTDTLECPKCRMTFSQEEHVDLLDHINECCD